jgi:hypothetical protein
LPVGSNKGLAVAMGAGIGLSVWRQVRQSGKLPVPANMLGLLAMFAALAAISDVVPASRQTITLLVVGLDVAGLFSVLPNGLFTQVQKAQSTEAAAEGQTS